jgi:hypothetical protein
MYAECRHVMPSGLRCHSPALRHKPYCYFHARLHRAAEPRSKFEDLALRLPPLEDHRAIQVALSMVLRDICSGELDSRRASLLLRGLQIAERLARPQKQNLATPPTSPTDYVDYVDDAGLAPEKNACEPPGDCPGCESRSSCRNSKYLMWDLQQQCGLHIEAAVEEKGTANLDNFPSPRVPDVSS